MPDWTRFSDRVMREMESDRKQGVALYRRNAFRTWHLLKRPEVHGVVRKISEAQIEKKTAELLSDRDHLSETAIKQWSVLGVDEMESKAILLLALARALDLHLIENQPFALGFDKKTTFQVASRALGTGFVIPHAQSADPHRKSRQRNAVTRGFLNHRIVPEQLDSNRHVNIVFLRGIDGIHGPAGSAKPPKLAGGLFRGLHVTTRKRDEKFIVEQISANCYLRQIDEHISSARQAACDVLLFPELTVNATGRERIVQQLQTAFNVQTSQAPNNPIFVIGGSWHQEFGLGQHENVAPVYDRWGILAAEHKKFIAYYDKDEGAEDIIVGNTILCLATSAGLFAVAICLDFCDGAAANRTYPEIDADGILVVSMGGDNTMNGHKQNARNCYETWRGRTFVVQQGADPCKPPLGYILRSWKSLSPKASDTATSESWHMWDWSERDL